MPTPPFLLSVAQIRRPSSHYPLSYGIPRVDNRRVLSDIIYGIRHGLLKLTRFRGHPEA